jgi:hypothetical protein
VRAIDEEKGEICGRRPVERPGHRREDEGPFRILS